MIRNEYRHKCVPFVSMALGLLACGGALHAATSGAHVVVGEERWENRTYLVVDPVVIGAGATLVINNAQVDFQVPHGCAPGDPTESCTLGIEVLDGGRLLIADSSLATSQPGTDRDPMIHVSAGGFLRAERSSFQGFSLFAVTGPRARAELEDNTIHGSDVGFDIGLGASGNIEGNRFDSNIIGLRVVAASPVISDNDFNNTYWMNLYILESASNESYGTRPFIVGNRITGGGFAIVSYTSDGYRISGNQVSGTGGTAAILLRILTSELYSQEGSFLLDGNTITSNQRALWVETTGRQTPGPLNVATFTGNVIRNTACTLVEAHEGANAPLLVDARNNDWGASPPVGGGGCPAFVGNVIH